MHVQGLAGARPAHLRRRPRRPACGQPRQVIAGCGRGGLGTGQWIAVLRGNQRDGLCDGPVEVIVRRRYIRERRAQVGTGVAMGRANLGDRMVTANDGDCLTTLDGIEQIREMPGCLGYGHSLHEAIFSSSSYAPVEPPICPPGRLSQPWKGERSPAAQASRRPGAPRSQSGRISLVAARRSCHRSPNDGRPQNQ
jgi:hypothetical protein